MRRMRLPSVVESDRMGRIRPYPTPERNRMAAILGGDGEHLPQHFDNLRIQAIRIDESLGVGEQIVEQEIGFASRAQRGEIRAQTGEGGEHDILTGRLGEHVSDCLEKRLTLPRTRPLEQNRRGIVLTRQVMHDLRQHAHGRRFRQIVRQRLEKPDQIGMLAGGLAPEIPAPRRADPTANRFDDRLAFGLKSFE